MDFMIAPTTGVSKTSFFAMKRTSRRPRTWPGISPKMKS